MDYNGVHSITFDDKNTWSDWKLAPLKRPAFAPPKMRTKLVSIPGTSSTLDLSTSLTGYSTFDNTEGTWEFLCDPDVSNWEKTYENILSYLHGQKRKAILSDDPDWYREGVFMLDSISAEQQYTKYTIRYSAKPYKKRLLTVAEMYPIIFSGTVCSLSSYQDVVPNIVHYFDDEPVVPWITASADSEIYVRYHNYDYNMLVGYDMEKGLRIMPGTRQYPEIVLGGYSLDNTVIFECIGYGLIKIDWRQGRL